MPGVHALACDTDGIDGSEDERGCLVVAGVDRIGGSTRSQRPRFNDEPRCVRILSGRRSADRYRADSTNVNDYRVILMQ